MATDNDSTPHHAQGVAAFEHRLAELDAVRSAHAWHPMFRAWRERTTDVFERFLPESVSRAGFLAIQFAGASASGNPDADTASRAGFAQACEQAAACLRSAITQVQQRGSDTPPAGSPGR